MRPQRALKQSLQLALLNDRKVVRAMDAKAQDFFERAKNEMLQEFDGHPITRDLNNEGDAGLVTRGSLFGFLGFEDGDQPTGELREALERGCKIKFHKEDRKTGVRQYTAQIPTRAELFRATPLRWARGRSWLKGIEHGISGVGQYMSIDTAASRSGEGIQVKGNVGGRFKNAAYMSTILNHFKKKLQTKGIKF
jgi:hypothetical protein